MMVIDLARMLTTWTKVSIRDYKTGKELYRGDAGLAHFNDTVKTWDFSEEVHIIYIQGGESNAEEEKHA